MTLGEIQPARPSRGIWEACGRIRGKLPPPLQPTRLTWKRTTATQGESFMDRRQWGLTLTMAAASSVWGEWQSSLIGARLGGRQQQPNGASRARKRWASGGDERDWPDFLGVNRDGCSSVKLQRRDWSKLPLVWRFNLGEGYALGSGRSELWIQTDRQGAEERTTCLRLDTGEMVWE